MSDAEDGKEQVVGTEAEEQKTKPASPGPTSKALKDIVNFDEDEQDINTELFRSTIRTTPLDSDKDPLGVYELLNPESSEESEGDTAKDALARKAVEKEALQAAKDSGGDSDEELEEYSGDLTKKEDSVLTIERCFSDGEDISLEKGGGCSDKRVESEAGEGGVDVPEGDVEGLSMDTDEDRPLSPMDENGNTEDFEIVDAEMIEKLVKESQDGQKDKSSGEEEAIAGLGKTGEEENLRTVEGLKGEEGLITEGSTDKTKMGKEGGPSEGDHVNKVERGAAADKEPRSPTGGKAMDVDVVAEDKERTGDRKEESAGDRPAGDNQDEKEEKGAGEDSTDSAEQKEEKATSDFDDLEVGTRLDTHLQKSRARLGKTGALAQRRKPPRSSWYVEEGQDLSQFRITDSTQPKPFKEIKEEEEEQTRGRPSPASRTPPKPSTRRPPGAMGGPLLIPGLGQIGQIKLKKTNNLDPKTKSPFSSTAKPPRNSPVGHKVFPVPATRPAVPSKKKAPPPVPGGKSPLNPIGSKNTTTTTSKKTVIPSKETEPHSPMDKSSPVSPPKGVGFRLPSPTEAKPLKTRPKPMPKPRPQSIAASSSPSNEDPLFANTKSPRTSRDDLNSDILNSKANTASKSSKTPLWSFDKNKKLPPISPTKEEVTPTIPKWKQELLKKKKEAEAQEHQPPSEDSSIKKTVIPPPLPKKDGPASDKAPPFTTVPQWQLNLAEKNRKKKEHDEVDLGSRPAKERKTEDSNKIEATKKPPITPKPAIIARKKFDAIPPKKDTIPSRPERRKKNQKNLLIETNGEKKDTEKSEVASPTKKGLPLVKSAGYHSNVPLWKLEVERMQSPLSQRFNRPDLE